MVFKKVAETQEISLGQMKAVKFGAEEVLLANVNGVYYAIRNVCTHEGGNLSKGTLQGNIVSCPKHKAQFDVTTGKVVSPPAEALSRPDIEDLPTYLVKIDNQDIMVKV